VPENVENAAQARSFWSGVITFGLVSVPVKLYSAYRAKSVALRMVDHDGTPLSREYYCPKDDEPLEQDEISRGYEVNDERFVIVTDEELDSLEPKKSREIDLQRFVKRAEIDPVFFQRAYYLAPDGPSHKAYRLLARTMEENAKAGVATFVMRGKEYIVAILADKGILRAETLHFVDEIRSPEDVGIPESDAFPKQITQEFIKEIKKRSARKFDPDMIINRYALQLKELVQKKLEENKDVARGRVEQEKEGATIIDLMDVLKQSFQQEEQDQTNLQNRSKDELYEIAQQLDIPGRSKMSKFDLIKAIKKAS
jgi:DNA end-binding protein Ku